MATEFDAILMRLGLEWLTQYARFLRRDPVVVASLRDRRGEFEMVPVPKTILSHLALPGLVGSGNLGGGSECFLDHLLGDHEVLTEAGAFPEDGRLNGQEAGASPLVALVREFAANLGAGDLSRLSALLSERFLDADGRTRDDIETIADALIQATKGGRVFFPKDVTETSRSDTGATVRVSGRWEWHEPEGQTDGCEELALEFLFEPDEWGVWKIANIKSL
jgi:hypothetical protein